VDAAEHIMGAGARILGARLGPKEGHSARHTAEEGAVKLLIAIGLYSLEVYAVHMEAGAGAPFKAAVKSLRLMGLVVTMVEVYVVITPIAHFLPKQEDYVFNMAVASAAIRTGVLAKP